jgi:hypothetical protein
MKAHRVISSSKRKSVLAPKLMFQGFTSFATLAVTSSRFFVVKVKEGGKKVEPICSKSAPETCFFDQCQNHT